MLKKEEMLAFLHREVVPALGCTEPVCVAIAAADAAKTISKYNGKIERIEVVVNPNIYKNGMSVGIPGFDGVGLNYAAALGAYIQKPEKKLEILKEMTPEIAEQARRLADEGKVNVTIDRKKQKIYVACKVITDKGTGFSVIQDSHTNIVLTQENDVDVFRKEAEDAKSDNHYIEELLQMSIGEIRALVDLANEEELAFLMDGAVMNDEVVEFGLNNHSGVGIADSMKADMGTEFAGEGLMERMMLKVAASIEGRLDGCPYSVMSSAGAGSKGLALIVPVNEAARHVGASNEQFLKALAFGHLVNSYINARIGKLSAMCTCVVAAATAASAAMTWLFSGQASTSTDEQIGWAIRNMTGTVTGMICDGGKVGCALKLATASAAAFMCARMAVNNAALRVSDGICAQMPEECIMNIGRIGNPGMVETDREILNVMLEKGK